MPTPFDVQMGGKERRVCQVRTNGFVWEAGGNRHPCRNRYRHFTSL